MKKQPKEEAKWWEPLLLAILLIFAIAGIGGLVDVGAHFAEKLYTEHFPPEKSPGELVDLAMSMPGAIVISPHRDLSEYGIDDLSGQGVGGPSIAIKTDKKWCIWSLAKYALWRKEGWAGVSDVAGGNFMITGSWDAYQTAYDSFTECVQKGNGK